MPCSCQQAKATRPVDMAPFEFVSRQVDDDYETKTYACRACGEPFSIGMWLDHRKRTAAVEAHRRECAAAIAA